MTRRYLFTDDVRPMVIALLQAYGPTEAVAEVTGVPNKMIRAIYSRYNEIIYQPVYDKIEAAYKKIPQRAQPSRDEEM